MNKLDWVFTCGFVILGALHLSDVTPANNILEGALFLQLAYANFIIKGKLNVSND